LFHITQEADRQLLLPSIVHLKAMGFSLAATSDTAPFFKANGLPHEELYWNDSKTDGPKCLDALIKRSVDLVINIPSTRFVDIPEEKSKGYMVRRVAVDHSIPVLTNAQVAVSLIQALSKVKKMSVEAYSNPRD
jgi:hypothetical protein